MFALHGYKKKCLLYVPLISYFVCCQTKLYFKPKRVVIDSEVAIHKAVGQMLLLWVVSHLAQCWFRKI
jgi:hypothetical protein